MFFAGHLLSGAMPNLDQVSSLYSMLHLHETTFQHSNVS